MALPGCGSMGGAEARRLVDNVQLAINEQLPLGSTPQDVEAFLIEQGFESFSTSGPNTGAGGSFSDERPDLVDDVTYTTGASIRDANIAFLHSESIFVRFYYNEDREMIWSIVEIVWDSI